MHFSQMRENRQSVYCQPSRLNRHSSAWTWGFNRLHGTRDQQAHRCGNFDEHSSVSLSSLRGVSVYPIRCRTRGQSAVLQVFSGHRGENKCQRKNTRATHSRCSSSNHGERDGVACTVSNPNSCTHILVALARVPRFWLTSKAFLRTCEIELKRDVCLKTRWEKWSDESWTKIFHATIWDASEPCFSFQ